MAKQLEIVPVRAALGARIEAAHGLDGREAHSNGASFDSPLREPTQSPTRS